MIPRKIVLCLAFGQLIAWGITYYLIGVFGDRIAADLGWSRQVVHGGFAAALLVMGMASPLVGRLVDRRGGRRAMVAGALLTAAGCILLSLSRSLAVYYAAWVLLGVAMRLTLYDAAFAALARLGGPRARRPMSEITLLGGLASSTFWPLGHLLADHFGWRGAVVIYAGLALLTIPLYLSIPEGRADVSHDAETVVRSLPLAADGRDLALFGGLYALIMSLASFLNAGMAAHMIGVLNGLGLSASAAVWIASLRGVGQSLARLCEVLSGGRIDPLTLNLVATLVLPFAFAAGLAAGVSMVAAIVFAFFYGVGNGLLTITRGTLPLVLFDYRTYGTVVGRLIAPSFALSATAPVIYAFVAEHFGDRGALYLSAGLSAVALVAAALLQAFCRRRRLAGS